MGRIPWNGIVLRPDTGPIFKLSLVGQDRYFVTSAALLDELCDERRFCKAVSGGLQEVRHGVKDGLFTAYHGEHNWEVAHRTLVPAFGPIGIHDMCRSLKAREERPS